VKPRMVLTVVVLGPVFVSTTIRNGLSTAGAYVLPVEQRSCCRNVSPQPPILGMYNSVTVRCSAVGHASLRSRGLNWQMRRHSVEQRLQADRRA
jgi:hypothetical protein